MHPEVSNFIVNVREKHPDYFFKKKVLEVGSLDINGSIRSLFIGCDYTGLDIGPGPGVDIICPIHEFGGTIKVFESEVDEEGYDVVISTEMLEHDVHWKESLQRMYDLTKEGGIFILTCAGPNRQEHGTKRTTPQDSPFTTDYYRNISIEDFESVLSKKLFNESSIALVRGDTDLQFYGIKKNLYVVGIDPYKKDGEDSLGQPYIYRKDEGQV